MEIKQYKLFPTPVLEYDNFIDNKECKELKEIMIKNDIDFHEYAVDYNTINDIYRDLFRNKS